MPSSDATRRAYMFHRRIRRGLKTLRTTKVDVYFLLCEFKRSRLYRCLYVAPSPRHARKTGDRRRLSTWEDYLASLSDEGISFGYFAELERLERRFGPEFVRLCALGIPVETRRMLLRAPQRVVERVKETLASNLPDRHKIEAIQYRSDMWRSDYENLYPVIQTPHQRVSKYRRYARRWEEKFLALARQVAQVPSDFRFGWLYADVVRAWRDVFELHLESGLVLARTALLPDLGLSHHEFLTAVQAGWRGSRCGPTLSAAG